MPKKIAVFTGTRADYGLLYWLISDIQASEELTQAVNARFTRVERVGRLAESSRLSCGIRDCSRALCCLGSGTNLPWVSE